MPKTFSYKHHYKNTIKRAEIHLIIINAKIRSQRLLCAKRVKTAYKKKEKTPEKSHPFTYFFLLIQVTCTVTFKYNDSIPSKPTTYGPVHSGWSKRRLIIFYELDRFYTGLQLIYGDLRKQIKPLNWFHALLNPTIDVWWWNLIHPPIPKLMIKIHQK